MRRKPQNSLKERTNFFTFWVLGMARTVVVGTVAFKPPTRKRTYLVKVPRSVLHLSVNDEYEYVGDFERRVELLVEGIAHKGDYFLVHSGLVCDSCNNPLKHSYIWILIIDGYPWGAICESCRQKYHSKLPAFVLTE